MSGISEDFCRCGHVASAHADGEGECGACLSAVRSPWTYLARCHHFVWSMTWEERAS